jgi:hypothetical protein
MDHYYTDSPHNFASSMHHNQFNISHFNSASDNAYNSFLYGDADSSPAPPLQLIMSRQHLPTPPPNIPPTTFSSCPLVEPTPSLHKSSPGLFVNNQPYPDFSFPEPEAMLTTIAPEATYELGFTQSPASITTSFRLNKRGSSSDETLEFDYESSENGNGYPKSRRTMGSGKSTRRKKASRRTGSISSMEDDEKRKLFLERNRQGTAVPFYISAPLSFSFVACSCVQVPSAQKGAPRLPPKPGR